MLLHIRPVTWNPVTSAYVALPDGARARALDPSGLFTTVLDEARVEGGVAVLTIPDGSDAAFDASLGGDAIEGRSGPWAPPDPWPAHLGHRRPRGGEGSAESPFVVRFGRELFLRFVGWDEASGDFRPAPAGMLVTAWDADLLGDNLLASGEIDADGRVSLQLAETESEPDLFFTVERPAAADGTAPRDPLPARWSSRDTAGEDRPDHLGYWPHFTAQRLGSPDEPYVFSLNGDGPYVHPGNAATLVVDGPALLQIWEDAIASATASLHLEVMLYFDDPMTRRIQAKIVQRAREGVKVRLLLGLEVTRTNKDFIRTEMLWARLFRRFTDEQREQALAALARKYEAESRRSDLTSLIAELRDTPNVTVIDNSFSRVEILPGLHGPLPSAYAELEGQLPLFAIARVDHRKLLLVDGRVAVLGGHNVGEEYVYEHPFDPVVADGTEEWTKWHDVSVRLEGPVVRDLQHRFRERWVSEGGDAFDTGATIDGEGLDRAHPTFPRLDPRPDGLPVQIVDTTPGARLHFQAKMLGLFGGAKREILVMNPYFSSPEALGALTAAARRGVRVAFVLPDQRNDSIDFLYAGRLWYQEMLDAGIEVYEYQNHMCHAKVAVVDDVAVVGTANLNHSSFFHHYELAAVIEDAGFARRMRAALWERDLPWVERIKADDLPRLLDINAAAEVYLREIVHQRF